MKWWVVFVPCCAANGRCGVDRLLRCCYGGGVRAITVRVEDDLFLAVKERALHTGVTVQEVGTRLLSLYAGGDVPIAALRGAPVPFTSSGREVDAVTEASAGRTGSLVGESGASRPEACSRKVYHRKGEFCKECKETP